MAPSPRTLDRLAQAYASADVFLMPSATETLGFVVLEAMASGLPVVAARAGGIPDLIQSDHDGILYEPGAPEEATKAVCEVLSSRNLRERLARGAAWLPDVVREKASIPVQVLQSLVAVPVLLAFSERFPDSTPVLAIACALYAVGTVIFVSERPPGPTSPPSRAGRCRR